MRKSFGLLMSAAVLIMGGGEALAVTRMTKANCILPVMNVDTVKIGNLQQVPDMHTVMNYSCTPPNPLTDGQTMVYCWHLHDNGGTYDKSGYRTATRGKYGIHFNYYVTSQIDGWVPVGTIASPYNIWGYATAAGNTYVVNDPVTVRFVDNEGTTNLPSGKYTYSSPKTHVTMAILERNDAFTKTNACGGGTAGGTGEISGMTGNSTINISVDTYCNAAATEMNFGKQPGLNKQLQTTATVTVDCSAGTNFDVSIDSGLHPSGGVRRMQRQKVNDSDAVTYIQYSISPEKWSGIGLGTGLSKGLQQEITGIVPPQPAPLAGTYTDTLKITVTYQVIYHN